MSRRILPALLALSMVTIGCAGPARLAERSEQKLSSGDHWRAWQLATRSLDKQPGNPRARAAATEAGAAIALDWERRIHALADVDTSNAADQVLEFAQFRANAAHYVTIPVSPSWPADESALRLAAARIHYTRGALALQSRRPKAAYDHFRAAEAFVSGYRDAARLADRAYEKALTRVAFVPFSVSSGGAAFGRDVADSWRDDLTQHMAPPLTRFTRILGAEAVEQAMSVSQLGRVSRDDAVALGRKAGAQRVVWGSIGGVHSDTRLQFFRDAVARRVVTKGPDGNEVTRWVEVPIEVVARVRDVTVEVEYEVISTRDGTSLAHQRGDRATSARVVWTSYNPVGDLAAYALVSETLRAANPDRAREVESRWKSVCGDQTTLGQVLEARRTTGRSARYDRGVLPRFIAGAAFVFLEDLPPAEDLAFAAVARGWQPLEQDLVRLDGTDDVDLGVALTGDGR
jgi:hypothetical protein